MQFCQRHWGLMRAAVEARGMSALVAQGCESAVANILMEKLGPSAMYLLGAGDEDPIDLERIAKPALKEKYRGKTWPRCPVCYTNIAHEISCTDPRCRLAEADGYDVCIEWSADAMKEEFDKKMA